MFTSISQLPKDLHPFVRLIARRDECSHNDVLDQINDAVAELSEVCSSECGLDSFDEVDFMQDHFGLEPDYFPLILNLINPEPM